MKNRRQDKILELIEQYDIETQDNLIERLQAAGFPATQATISRDIRELKLSKVMTGRGGYKYIRRPVHEEGPGHRFNRALVEAITTVESAGNIVVVKTSAGMANAVATAIEAALSSDIVGCVAGDDTILIVVRDSAAATHTAENLKVLVQLR